MSILDTTIVNVALETLHHKLHSPISDIQWVITGYLLSLATVIPLTGPLGVWGFDSKARIAQVHAPLLVIHGDHDQTVPYRLGRQLYEAAPGPKSFWTVAGGDHNDLLEAAGPEYRERLRRFYALLQIPAVARQP